MKSLRSFFKTMLKYSITFQNVIVFYESLKNGMSPLSNKFYEQMKNRHFITFI